MAGSLHWVRPLDKAINYLSWEEIYIYLYYIIIIIIIIINFILFYFILFIIIILLFFFGVVGFGF